MNSEKNIRSGIRKRTTDYTDNTDTDSRLSTDNRQWYDHIREISVIRGKAFKFLFFHCVLFFLLTFTSPALDASEREFIWTEANARMQGARTQADYLRAASIYQRLIDDGVRNGPLFYNIGTAMLAAGLDAQAFNAFERAERYLGRQADIGHNLEIAFANKTKSATVDLPWYRLAAFWHFSLSCPQRSAIAAYAFLLFWLALTLRRLGIRRVTGAIALLGLLVFVVFVTSVAASWQMESTERRYNLTIPPAVVLTNMPAPAGQSSTN